MSPSPIATETKSATEDDVVARGGCLHCGTRDVRHLIVIWHGKYVEVACREPFACFERIVLAAGED